MLHGHNYRVHFTCEGTRDAIGRVLDFSAIKDRLCEWLELHWDHRFLAWEHDDTMRKLWSSIVPPYPESELFDQSLVWVPFNPTAENMAAYLLRVVAPIQLRGTGVCVTEVRVDETRKCSAVAREVEYVRT
jgi:6-pyruvoyltetrahydropterin/6-carboxytetrahydropterin synthase